MKKSRDSVEKQTRIRRTPAMPNRLRKIRLDHHMKQEEMARVLGLSHQYYTCLEHGKYNITADKIKILRDKFDVTADYILDFSDDGKRVHVSKSELDIINYLHQIDELDFTNSIREIVEVVYLNNKRKNYVKYFSNY